MGAVGLHVRRELESVLRLERCTGASAALRDPEAMTTVLSGGGA